MDLNFFIFYSSPDGGKKAIDGPLILNLAGSLLISRLYLFSYLSSTRGNG